MKTNTSAIWPPTGIALAALLLLGPCYRPGVSQGVLLGSLLDGTPAGLALRMTVRNTLEAVVGAYPLRRLVKFQSAMDRIRGVVGFAIVAPLRTTFSASVGTTTLLLSGQIQLAYLGGLWLTWWIGDLLGALVVAPALCTPSKTGVGLAEVRRKAARHSPQGWGSFCAAQARHRQQNRSSTLGRALTI